MKTSKKQFEQFKKSFYSWQKKLNLSDWKVFFLHTELDDDETFADICCDTVMQVATVRMCSELNPIQIKVFNPSLIAKHEVLELLVGKLRALARARYVTENEILEANHRLVQTLENLL